MKIIKFIFESIIIILALILIVLPEILFSCLLRIRDKFEDWMNNNKEFLWVNKINK